MRERLGNRNKRIRGKTVTTWFITFMVISVAQFLVWILATEIVAHVVRKQTNEVYGKALNILIQSYQNSVASVCSMLDVMALDGDIEKEIDSTEDVWKNEITRRKLASYKSQYPYVDDIYIYFQEEERVISANTVASSRLFFEIYGDIDMTYEEWRSFMRQPFSKSDVSRDNASGKRTLWILHTWPVFSGGETGGAVVAVKFNTLYMQGMADNFGADNYVGVIVRNREGELIAESGNVDEVRKGREVIKISEESGWTYTAYMSNQAIQVYERGFLPVLFLCFGAEALVFLFAFSFFLRTNYSPFTELVEYVNTHNPKESMDGSEYVYIRDSFEEIMKKARKDEEEIVNKLNRLKIIQLMYLMENDIPMEKADRHTLEEMQLSYVFDCCAVLLISGDITEYVERQEDSFALLHGAGVSMEEGSAIYGCSFVHEGVIVCVFRPDKGEDELRSRLAELWEKVSKEIPDKCVMAVSSLQGGCNRLRKAYEEALFAMQGAKGLSMAGILLYDEIRESVRESVRDNKDEYIVRLVQEYIRQHYPDPDLNVGRICEDIEKSVSYVSRLFKEKTGQSILYYINMVRIENAKRLLRESDQDVKIEEIGRESGFANSNSFIRIFKKYEQVTPGKYRELNQFRFGD